MADKEAIIVLRLSAELKATIAAAAERLGVSLTTFITDTALKRALQLQRDQAAGADSTHVPTDFRTLCKQAASGAANGYATAGWHLAAVLGVRRAPGADGETWSRQVDALKALLANHDDEGTWRWFQQYYPHWMALVPDRRREQFLYGVRRAYEEDLINA